MFKIGRSNKIVLIVNVLFGVLLTASYFSSQVSPREFYPMAFAGLFYPLLVLANIFFLIYWLVQFRIYAFISFLVLIAGINSFNKVFVISFGKKEISNEKQAEKNGMVKLMSYNVRLFDLYNWSNNKFTRDSILQFLESENPDILALQEFYADDRKNHIDIEYLKKKLNMPFIATHYTITLRKTDHWGLAIFSKYPILNYSFLDYGTKSNNACVYADIKIKEDTFRIYNIHLQSIHFKKEDYAYIDSLKSEKDKPVENVKSSKRIIFRLKRAFVKRAKQVDSTAMNISYCRYKKIICGDFNDSPISYTYGKLSEKMQDAFLLSGKGLGQTYNGSFPNFRIDYILHSPDIESALFKIHHEKYSDHFPLSIYFK